MPADTVISLQRGWGLFRKGSSGKILLRLTYKAYVEDEEDDPHKMVLMDADSSDNDNNDEDDDDSDGSDKPDTSRESGEGPEPMMELLAALLLSHEFSPRNSMFPGDSSSLIPIDHRSYSKKGK